MQMTSSFIINTLAKKHSKDLFVVECKDGSSWNRNTHRRLDAWVLKRTWSPMTSIGYEIKVSRQDFERDDKWCEYLPLCHKFYFVSPTKLILPVELPKGVGLIWVNDNGKPRTMVHAARNNVDEHKLLNLVWYIIMWRTVIASEYDATGMAISREELYRLNVKEAQQRNDLARFIRGHIRQTFDAMSVRVTKAEKIEIEAKELVAYLAKNGVNWAPGESRLWQAKEDIAEVLGIVDKNKVVNAFCTAERLLSRAREQISQVLGE
jgi:hypothetical protein